MAAACLILLFSFHHKAHQRNMSASAATHSLPTAHIIGGDEAIFVVIKDLEHLLQALIFPSRLQKQVSE
jgi:hypothetical protein